MRRLAATLLAAAVLVVASATPAGAALLLPDDAEILVAKLGEATLAQTVCYGWRVTITDENGSTSTDTGSNLGVGAAVAVCPRYAELQATVRYTSASSEAEDSASWTVVSTEPGLTTSRLEDATGLGAKALVGEDDDRTLYTAVAAMPLLVAEGGSAPFVPAQLDAPKPAADAPDTDGGSDFLRTAWGPLLFFLLVLVGGGVTLVYARLTARPKPAHGT